MITVNARQKVDQLTFQHNDTLYISRPNVNHKVLQDSFNFVPYDTYWTKRSRYRTTSRCRYTAKGIELLPQVPLYQPSYVNKLEKYGNMDRYYDDAPISLIESKAFYGLITEWLSLIPMDIETFSIHQIRTTDYGSPTPEGAHRDGTDWTGIYVAKRHNITYDSAATQYWDPEGNTVYNQVVPEGCLVTHFDNAYTHMATNIKKYRMHEPSYRDVFVLTIPEHGVNHEEEEKRRKV